MDKNMIHIDELVKQRLSGGEEREMPGSWTRMRELLDQEMPEKRRIAGYYNWRRMLGVMAGLTLLSVLTIGSYNLLVNAHRLNTRTDEKVIAAANTTTVLSGKPNNSTKSLDNRVLDDKTVTKVQKTSAVTGKETIKKDPKKHVLTGTNAVAATNKVATTNKNVDETPLKAEYADNSIGKLSANISEDKHIASPVLQNQEVNSPAASRLETSRHNQVAIAEDAIAKPIGGAHINQLAIVQSSIPEGRHIDEPGFGLQMASLPVGSSEQPVEPSNSFSATITSDNTRLKVTPAPIQPDLPKDTLNKLQIVQRMTINPLTRMSHITLDTIAVERLVVNKAIADPGGVSDPDMAVASAATPAASTASAEMAASETLVPLSNFKIQSRKTNKWNARSFDEVVRDVRFNLAQTKFYPGISAGGNSYVFNTNNLSGFQLGLFGLFSFGETWGAMGELKYIQRFNSGATLNDNYIDVVQKQGSYLQGNVEHFFKFTSLQSIEMPLALRYAAGRLNLFGGLNLAYHFAVNVDEQTFTSADTAYKPFNNPGGKIKDRPSVTYSDFRARFALGGLLGISYELLPSLQLDFRATKNVWDNAYGLGAEQVSSQLYNAASIQFSIFYRFSQKNQIPKAK